MKTIDLERVLTIIDTPEVPAGGFIDVIKDFVAKVQEYCLQERDIPQRIRTLWFARAELQSAQLGIAPGTETNRFLIALFESIVSMIDCELKIVQIEIDHPDRFVRPYDDCAPFALWKGTVAELLELVVALTLTGLLHNRNGAKMTLAEAVELCERVFGIKISDLYGRKARLLARKKSESPFLERLLALYRKAVEESLL